MRPGPQFASMFLLAVALVVAVVPAAAQLDDLIEHTNPLLGPAYAQWLVGPIAEIASEQERREYLSLTTDEEAERFIEEFWKGDRVAFRWTFDERVRVADQRYTEGTYPGSRTDRGTVFILHGEPEEIRYEEFRHVGEAPVELWEYPKKAEKGLDGRRPDRVYRFVKKGDLTIEFRKGGPNDPAVERRRRPDRFRPPPR